MNVHTIRRSDSLYPEVLKNRLAKEAPAGLYALGETAILRQHLLGLICSIQCPGSVVLKTFDTVRALKDADVTVAGGFLSPMERDCLDILLRGKQPIILCPARRLKGMRLGPKVRQAIDEGRLLVLSMFDDSVQHTTASQAVQRNNLVAALSDALFVPYAAPNGKTWKTIHAALKRKQPVYTFGLEDNATLIASGAQPLEFLLQRTDSKDIQKVVFNQL
ncbi:MAG: DNA-processing protein DprA [Syntrophales bacterium]|jgi:predicted Rossmann fold nucleotide-binding protein DprA/Smf involved in DNA uptake